jgi:hypothetical protein
MTFTEADGITPMANAQVAVLYMQPSDADQPVGTTINFTELGSGTTAADGSFSTALDTSAVAPSDLGDAGDGTPDAFNAMVVAIDPAGNAAIVFEIMTVGSQFSGAASVNEPAVAGQPATQSTAIPTTGIVLGTAFRYVPVTPLNSGYGMQAVLNYTINSSIQKETKVDIAVSNNQGGWESGGYLLEEQDRDSTSPYAVNGSFHDWMWASYKFVEYAYRLDNVWQALRFTGTITYANPDCCLKDEVINVVPYTVPTFTPGSFNQNWMSLTPANSGWTRSTGTVVGNDAYETFTLPFASDIGSETITTYQQITSVTYNWIPTAKCGTGYTRVIWGDNDDPEDTPRVEANCVPNSSL